MDAAIGPGDSLLIAAAIAECASFFLLRRETETEQMDTDIARQFGGFWLQVLGQHLSSETTSSMAKAADASLLQHLAESFFKFDDSSYNRPRSAIYRIKEWFWNEGIESTVIESKGYSADERWSELLNCIINKAQQQQHGESMHVSHANPVVRKRFHATLSKYQGKSDITPDSQAFDVMIASIRFCSANYIFEEDGDENITLEQFLLNDLLRWIVMDTSSLSIRKGQKILVQLDFTLLRECILIVPSPLKQKTLWETILRETIAAECDLELLSHGIVALLKKSTTAKQIDEILRCEVLDEFAIKVGEESVQKHQDHFLKEFVDEADDESYEDEARKTSIFLETCVGLNPGSSSVLVSQKVVHRWTEVAAPVSDEHVFQLGGNVDIQNPLITNLLSLVARGDRSILIPDDAERIALESWRRGGKQWNEEAMPLLLDEDVATRMNRCSAEHIVTGGAKELRELLDSFCRSGDGDLSHIALVCHVWSERAFRILALCSEAAKASSEGSLPHPSLALIGLADIDTWNSTLSGDFSVSHLYLCFVYVLQQFERQSVRLDLFVQSSDSSAKLAASILLTVSDAVDGVVVDPVTRRDQNCAFVLSLLGGKDIPIDLRRSWCREVIYVLSADMTSGVQEDNVRVTRGISILSEILFTMFGRIVVDERLDAATSDDVDASDVREGDELYYVIDEEGTRAQAKVVKVHSDDFPRLYFTIRVEQSDGIQERQTVAERLRRLPKAPDTCGDAIMSTRFSESEKEERVFIGDLIFEKLSKSTLVPLQESKATPVIDAASESVNILISHCGLIGKEGIASTRYEVFKLLSSLQSLVAQDLVLEGEAERVDSALTAMRALSLAIGLGNVVPASKNNFKLTKFIPDESTKAVVSYYANDDAKRTRQIDRAALEWLAISIGATRDSPLRKDAVSLLYKLGATVLTQEEMSLRENLADSVLVMRSVQNAVMSSLSDIEEGGLLEEHENTVTTMLVRSFACDWQGVAESVCRYQGLDVSKRSDAQLPDWYEPFRSFVKEMVKQRGEVVAMAAKRNCDDLVRNLFSGDKRLLAFRLLNSAADGEPIHLDYFTGEETQKHLAFWQENLIEEEAEELEDDVGLVGQWIPGALMNELESWEDGDGLNESDETAALGSMLCWLALLSFVDSAAAVDVRFRGSVGAYLEHIHVNRILGTALSYLNLEKGRSTKQNGVITMEDALDDRSTHELTKISGLVMSRTVEAFPSLFKRWWEDDCPKNRSFAVSQFVETKIAPDVLRRELARINNAMDMGDMTVSGSTVSREVTATYAQDEVRFLRFVT